MSCVTSSFVGVRANLAFPPRTPPSVRPRAPGARSCQVSTAIRGGGPRARGGVRGDARDRSPRRARVLRRVRRPRRRLLPALAADALLSDFDADTKDLIARQRALLTRGEGDVAAYVAKADAYFAGYKWDHKGHTNSFSSIMNTDIVIRDSTPTCGHGGAVGPRVRPSRRLAQGQGSRGIPAKRRAVRRQGELPQVQRHGRDAARGVESHQVHPGTRRSGGVRDARATRANVGDARRRYSTSAPNARPTRRLTLSLLNPVRTIHATGWALPAAGSSVRRRP